MKKNKYTIAQCAEVKEAAIEKRVYYDEEILAVHTIAHNIITGNTFGGLESKLKGISYLPSIQASSQLKEIYEAINMPSN